MYECIYVYIFTVYIRSLVSREHKSRESELISSIYWNQEVGTGGEEGHMASWFLVLGVTVIVSEEEGSYL